MARRGSADGPTGLVVVDKESGSTSHDVVASIRKIFRQRRTGHAGTLDPSATGVLLVGMGRATRLIRFLQDTTKCYEGTLVFGVTTTSLDADGEVTGTYDMKGLDAGSVMEAVGALTGDILQVPPMVSALKVDGVRLHELARQGIEVERAARPVRIDRFSVDPTDDPMIWSFSVICSSGTYVRTLVDDLGRNLGGGAHLLTLRRTAVGTFGINEAATLEVIAEQTDSASPGASPVLLSPAEALRHLAIHVVDADGAARVATGRSLEADEHLTTSGDPVAILDGSGALLAVYQPKGGMLVASVVLQAG